jgi:hypothetical protein
MDLIIFALMLRARFLSKEHLDLSFAIYVLLLKRQIVTLYSSGQGEIPYRR